jgi:hypothetical protein
MNGRPIFIIFIGFLILSVVSLLIVLWQRHPIFCTDSPSKTYRVELKYRYCDDLFLLSLIVPNRIEFDTYAHGKLAYESQPLLTEYWSDTNFKSLYPNITWESESILRFQRFDTRNNDLPDTVIIMNESPRKISYLAVSSLDLYLILNLEPGSRIVLPVPRYKELSWITAQGQYSDGSKIEHKGANFLHNDEIAQLIYYISVRDAGVEISLAD